MSKDYFELTPLRLEYAFWYLIIPFTHPAVMTR